MNSPGKTIATTALSTSASVSFEQMKQLAKSIAASKLFGVKTEDEALSLMMIAQAENRHPALAVRDYHIIQGRPSLKADTMLARFQAAGGKVDWRKYTDTECVAVFSHPQAGSVTVDWSLERAKNVKSYDKEKNAMIPLTDKLVWKNYSRAMLRARVISEGVRTCYPGIAVGVYTPEEIESADTEAETVTIVRTDAAMNQTASEVATALTPEEIEQHVDMMSNATTLAELQAAYMAGHEHAKQARDNAAKKRFESVYNLRSEDLKKPSAGAELT